uniref:CitMHS domain-containing protein n=1 Tax=Angiostrongylus cantonensis TaxID=6313 RepID=A0A158PAB2_ANGCA
MAVYWMTEVLPLPVTALLPVILLPLTGVMTSYAVAQQFINNANFLFIGGLIMAAAVEKCSLHERTALFVLKMVGSEPKWIMLGFMIVTAFLSMFISDTATTAMMVPIGQSVVSQLVASYNSHPENRSPNSLDCKRVSTALVLCICIAANIGGTGMLTGTPSNLVMVGQLQDILTAFFLRNTPGKDEHITELMRKRYTDLPKTSYAEKSVLCCFVLLLSLWMFRNPGFMKGFGALLPKGSYTDATSAIIVAILLFALPSEKPDLFTHKTKNEIKKQCRLMDWPTMQMRFPWNVVILLGGGFALAAGVKESGLSVMVGRTLAAFNQLPLWVMQVLTMVIVMATTNICSNTVTATIFVPIVATMAAEMKRHPFTLMIPTTLSCSFAFILPVATPSNAIVFSSGMVKVFDMVGVLLLFTLLLLLTAEGLNADKLVRKAQSSSVILVIHFALLNTVLLFISLPIIRWKPAAQPSDSEYLDEEYLWLTAKN